MTSCMAERDCEESGGLAIVVEETFVDDGIFVVAFVVTGGGISVWVSANKLSNKPAPVAPPENDALNDEKKLASAPGVFVRASMAGFTFGIRFSQVQKSGGLADGNRFAGGAVASDHAAHDPGIAIT